MSLDLYIIRDASLYIFMPLYLYVIMQTLCTIPIMQPCDNTSNITLIKLLPVSIRQRLIIAIKHILL